MNPLRRLLEGGNVFKDSQGQPLTQRISRDQIPATVAWLERVTGLDLTGRERDEAEVPRRWLGSTGRRPDSGDIDLVVTDVTKDQLYQHLTTWAQQNDLDPREWIKRAGELHFRTPIAGDAKNGFVQTDFNFFNDPKAAAWAEFYMGGTSEGYRGMHRNVLLSSLAKAQGLKIGGNGMLSRTTNELMSGGRDPDRVAEVVLGPGHDRRDLSTVERIYAALQDDPERDVKLADFREYLQREGLSEPTLRENDVSWLARLRDRIVNQGYVALVEAEQASVGGRAKGIEHLEDLVFRSGTAGIRQALEIVDQATASPATTTTVKWDGKPAVIFGRKPSTGEFVLTDGSGFEAKGYDGLATSPAMMARIQQTRGGDRAALIETYARLFPVLEQALPSNFRGYVKGDLLYMQTPPVVAGNYVFKPNTVEYRIPVDSRLGQRIGDSNIGIAMHTMYADQGEPRQPLSRVTFQDVPGLLLIEPRTSVPTSLTADPGIVRELGRIVRTQGRNIDTLFNPQELRANKITDLARLAVDYANSRVGQPLDRTRFLPEFGEWLQARVTPQKFRNIVEYLRSPTSNTEAMAAAFSAFLLLNDLKEDLRRQLDAQHPGQEGWVMATPAGYAKAVGRFDPEAFAARNRQQNR